MDLILKCSIISPSAANKQPWKIYIVEDKAVQERIYAGYNRDWFREAPLIVVFVGLEGENWVRGDKADYLLCDITIIADYFVLAATEQGLGTCYIAAFDEEIVHKALGLPNNEKVMLITPLGYPKEGAKRVRSRKDLSEVVKYI
ncbi:MAG: nitroreductase [Denitrovibrio sp.]|nr:MAG: nitroreductase [Denitrovibrio sp.]